MLLHAIFGIQFLLGFGAYWSRLATVGAARPMPVMIWLTVIHTVAGRDPVRVLDFDCADCVSACAAKRGTVAAHEPRQVAV